MLVSRDSVADPLDIMEPSPWLRVRTAAQKSGISRFHLHRPCTPRSRWPLRVTPEKK